MRHPNGACHLFKQMKKKATKWSLPSNQTHEEGGIQIEPTISSNKKKELSKQSLPSLQTKEEGGI
eukprot:4732689-Ditylum_brightwellii.AAC.1